MAMKIDSSKVDAKNDKLGIKIKGDLGDLQIIEETVDSDNSDNENIKSSKQVATRENNIPASLVHSTSVPYYGETVIKNSKNVQIGSNTYFNGPVTIQQIIRNDKSGVDNVSYTQTDDETSTSRVPHQKPQSDVSTKKIHLRTWHKLTFSTICIVAIGGICALVLSIQNKGGEDDKSPSEVASKDPSSSNLTKVVVLSYETVQLLISILMVPLTIFLMCYSLLTSAPETHDGQNMNAMIKKDRVRRNSNDLCMQKPKDVPLLIANNHLRIVSRTDWLAQPVENELYKIVQPVPWVIITHTATESCDSQSMCVLRVRLIQTFHIESRDWDDIGYNFLVGGDGSAYFGRGWDYIGAHTKGYNKYSIGIAFIGTFNNEAPPKKQIEACEKLIKLGVEQGKLAKDYKLFAHRQLMSTLSPGDKLYDIIKEWPHFVKNDTNLSDLIPNY